MFTMEQMLRMTNEEFAENWRNGKIQESCLNVLEGREPTETTDEVIEF